MRANKVTVSFAHHACHIAVFGFCYRQWTNTDLEGAKNESAAQCKSEALFTESNGWLG